MVEATTDPALLRYQEATADDEEELEEYGEVSTLVLVDFAGADSCGVFRRLKSRVIRKPSSYTLPLGTPFLVYSFAVCDIPSSLFVLFPRERESIGRLGASSFVVGSCFSLFEILFPCFFSTLSVSLCKEKEKKERVGTFLWSR